MTVWPFVAIVALIALNGFFVALEFALVASRRSRLEPLAADGDKAAQRSLDAIAELSVQLAGAQLGITVASLGLGLVGEPAVAHLLESLAEHIPGFPTGWVHPIAAVVGLLIVVFLHMVLGEMVPKNLTLTHPETTLRLISAPNRLYLLVARPFVKILNVAANAGVRVFGVEPTDELGSAHTAEELAVMVAASRRRGGDPELRRRAAGRRARVRGREVASIMVPEAQIGVISTRLHRRRSRGHRARPGPLAGAGAGGGRARRRARLPPRQGPPCPTAERRRPTHAPAAGAAHAGGAA